MSPVVDAAGLMDAKKQYDEAYFMGGSMQRQEAKAELNGEIFSTTATWFLPSVTVNVGGVKIIGVRVKFWSAMIAATMFIC